jgi:predicted hydrolase (HD superfamily)
MLSVLEADRLVSEHLGATSRAVHSRVVAQVMRLLAHGFAADADLWEVVGKRYFRLPCCGQLRQ